MIQMDHISFGFGGQVLFEDLSLHIRPEDRLGIVGPNGSGKTTLIRIVAGELGGYEGVIKRRKGISLGRLRQEGIADLDASVFDSALEPFEPIMAMERELARLYAEAGGFQGDDKARALERAGELQHRLEAGGGFDYRARTAEVLQGLGFDPDAFESPVRTLSGGWRMRVALVRLLLERPDVLLLDEPTNHLDLPAIDWFDSFLQSYPGAVVVISHDRWFLDRAVERIAEIRARKIELFNGSYSHYERERARRDELLVKRVAEQQREIERNERFIERFRYKATKAKSVQSRVKRLEKMERIEGPPESKSVSFSFKTRVRSGREVMRLEGVGKSYGDKQVLCGVDLAVERGDRLAILGANGLGKSTLIKVMAGVTGCDGERRVGHNVKIQYFAQDQLEQLNPERTVLEEASTAAGPEFEGNRIRTLLGVFLFSGDDADKPVGVLSGGEKSRLLLARIMADPANFLLLDEPMNHLDPPSRDMLEQVLAGYDGTMCFVSHDRRFIDRLATRIVEFTPEGMFEYMGNYEDYRRQKSLRAGGRAEERTAPESAPESAPAPAARPNLRRESRRERARVVAERSRVLNPIREAVARSEARVHELEARAHELETLLADPELYREPERIKTCSRELKSVNEELESALAEWESRSCELDAREHELELE